jgi:hypothetical protein
MSEQKIKPGSVVALISHTDQRMTVSAIDEKNAWCMWFHPSTKDLIEKKIPLVALLFIH